jgi:hypothetical protein
MASLLSSLGIGTPQADPAALLNQREVEEQTKGIKDSLKGTISSIDLAIKTGSLLGVSKEYTAKLEGLKKQANDLLNDKTLSPAQLDKKKKEIMESLLSVQTEQEKDISEKKIKEALDVVLKVEDRVKEVSEDPTVTAELLEEYRALLRKAQDVVVTLEEAIKTANEAAAIAAATKEGFQVGAADISIPVTPADILIELRNLDIKKEEMEEKEFNVKRFLHRFVRRFREVLINATLAIGMLLGGIIASNMYVKEPFVLMRIFYFAYGALLFPLPILFSIVKPPYWNAQILPVYPRAEGLLEVSTMDRLFSFEQETPAAIDLRLRKSQASLRVLSVLVTIVLGGMAYGYDLWGYIKTGG